MHYAGQLPRQVPVVGLHLIMILVLVLLYQTLVHRQCLAARVRELPADGKTGTEKTGGLSQRPKSCSWSSKPRQGWNPQYLNTSLSCLTLLSGNFLAPLSLRKALA